MDRETLLKEAVARHAQAVYNLALRVAGNPADAEDATQEAFAALAREAGKLREPGAVKTWLLRTALRGCWRTAEKDRHRRKAEKEVASMRAEEIQQGDDPGSWAPILRQAVDRLPEALRLPLLLRYEQGLSHAEIAEVAGCPVGSVSARLREGLGTLRKALPAALGIALAADAALEEALGAVPPAPLPAKLGLSLAALDQGLASGLASMIAKGGLMMSLKSKAGLGIAALLLLLAGIGGLVHARLQSPADAPDAPSRQEPAATDAGALAQGPPPEAAKPPVLPPAAPPAPAPVPGALVVGRITDAESLLPVEGFGVSARYVVKGKKWKEQIPVFARTDARGWYELQIAPEGLGQPLDIIYFPSGDYEHLTHEGVGPLAEGERRVLDVPVYVGDVIEAHVMLDDGDRIGSGEAGRREGVLVVNGVGPDEEIGLDLDGRARRVFPRFAGGGLLTRKDGTLRPDATIRAEVGGYLPSGDLPLAGFPRKDRTIQVEIRLKKGAGTRVMAEYGDGTLCRDYMLYCWPSRLTDLEARNKSEMIERCISDDKGRFPDVRLGEGDGVLTLEGLREGETYSLVVKPYEGFMKSPVQVEPGGPVHILMVDRGASIKGRLLDPDGIPDDKNKIYIEADTLSAKRHDNTWSDVGQLDDIIGPRVCPDKDGTFVLKGLRPGQRIGIWVTYGGIHLENSPARWEGVVEGDMDLVLPMPKGWHEPKKGPPPTPDEEALQMIRSLEEIGTLEALKVLEAIAAGLAAAAPGTPVAQAADEALSRMRARTPRE